MALPRVNEVPYYDTRIPSSAQKIKFRPFLVKEEKVLLLARESQDTRQALDAVVDTIKACVREEIDPKKLTIFDVEYLFLKIRSKSVGERIELNLACQTCEHVNPVSVDLDKIVVDVPKVNSKIQLTDTISLKMRWPSYMSVSHNDIIMEAKTDTEKAFAMTGECIEAIMTEDENISVEEVSQEELMEFIENLTSAQYEMIMNYVSQMPKLKHDIHFNCEKCSASNDIRLEGINDFF